MENKYIKDFVIAIVILVILAYGIQNYYLYQKTDGVPFESKYKKIALSEKLLKQIHNIERSIQDRKQFVFSVRKDPLEQNLIVKTQKDLEKQWREDVENMIRLQATIIPETGDNIASISYKGKTNQYVIGDSFSNRKIVDIQSGKVVYTYKGMTDELVVKKIPPKPAEIQTKKSKRKTEYNW